MEKSLVAIVVLTVSALAVAEERGPAETLSERANSCDGTLCVPGKFEFRYANLDDFAVDSTGTTHGVMDTIQQRWRIRPRLVLGKSIFIEAEADLLTGQIAGDESADGLSDDNQAFSAPTATDLRQLYLSWRTPIGLLRIGQQSSHFGLGLLANDGNDEAHDLFDDPNFGDISERVLFATKPLSFMRNKFAKNLILAAGYDVVFRDDNAELIHGDIAQQGLVSLVYKTEPLTVGVYFARRDQEDDDGDTLEATAYDFFARWKHSLNSHMDLTLATEIAVIDGRTTRVAIEQAPNGVDVIGLGAVLQASLNIRKSGAEFETRLEAGYATGDNNRNDDLVRQFKFDPGYHVGMILFQEVVARISANTVDLASDPGLSGQPPKGVELVATDGSITNTVYVNPTFQWKVRSGLFGALGVLAAWSVADFVDPWQSMRNGGYNFNYLGAAADSSYLGTEINTGFGYAFTLRDSTAVRFAFGLQNGLFIPGGAFNDVDGKPSLSVLTKTRTTFDIVW